MSEYSIVPSLINNNITGGSEPLNLPYFNTTNYPLAVKKQLETLKYTDDIKAMLHFHQFVPKEFFTRNTKLRGLLFVHTMGTGKTRLAVAIANYFREHDKRRQINVLLPKSLEGNFRKNIKEFTKHDDNYIDKNYKFISLNASNMFKQMSNVNKTTEELSYEKRLGEFMADVIKKNSLDNSLLIVDEAHNLFNSITNGSKNGLQLYDLIIRAKNLKIIFLTGTPIINDPFELVPCFNMLRGLMNLSFVSKVNQSKYIPTETNQSIDDIENNNENNNITDDSKNNTTIEDDKNNTANDSKTKTGAGFRKQTNKSQNKKTPGLTLLFSESRQEFIDYFIDVKNKKIKNKEKFANRIYGLTSYYGDLYFPANVSREGFPTKLETIVEKVPMSETQFSSYLMARNAEIEEDKRLSKFRGKDARFSSSAGGGGTYRVKSRQICNYAIPDYALGAVRGQKSRKKFIHKITLDDLQDTDKFSPKMGKILDNILTHKGQLGMVYSQFVSGEGLALFSRVLDANGWVNYLESTGNNGFDIKNNSTHTYAILSGNILPEERTRTINQFNDPSNKDGSKINILLLSGAVAEGIDLKRIRHVHIMEPFWNYARINQVETRAIRFRSHEDLPEDQQNVQVYIYLSDYPPTYPKKKIIELTTDIDLYKKSVDNMKIINDFLHVIAETSIDCSLHYPRLPDEVKEQINCKLCSPDNNQLFHPLLTRDMILPSNCVQYKETKVTAKELTLPDSKDKYYYKIDKKFNDISLYSYDKKLNGYVPMPRTHYHYGTLMQMIINKENI